MAQITSSRKTIGRRMRSKLPRPKNRAPHIPQQERKINQQMPDGMIGWVEAIDPDNTPGLQKPVKSTGERIGLIFKDKWTEEIIISFLSYPSRAMFSGSAIIKLCPKRRDDHARRGGATRKVPQP